MRSMTNIACAARCACALPPHAHVSAAAQGHRRRRVCMHASNQQQERKKDVKPDQPSAPSAPRAPAGGWQQRLERAAAGARARWDEMDARQRIGALATGAVLLFAIPKVLTLTVLAGERVLIGSLLAAEELLFALALKAGVIGGAAVAAAAAVATAYAFVVPRSGGGGGGGGDGKR